jgi:UDP-glucose:(heptosyl)LPS alpha-1,3-glucosyltransferase
MRLAFLLYQYSPLGGKQLDCRYILEELTRRGHNCRLYCPDWQGEEIEGVDTRLVTAAALGSHRRRQRFLTSVQADLTRDPVAGVIGFDAMPGLDIFYAYDPCYLDAARREQGLLGRRGARFRHFADCERAVFAPGSDTEILLLWETERDNFVSHYQTPLQRMHVLPAGVAPGRRAPDDAAQRRKYVRNSLGLEPLELTLLFVGSRFTDRGLDRVITALAHAREAQPNEKFRLLVVGEDKPKKFQRLARRLGVADGIEFLGGREDVPDLMLGADVLVHPALLEPTGAVLLDAIAAGLSVIATDVCACVEQVKIARAGILLPAPFSQEQLDQAVLRNIDGVYRAECRRSALQYAQLTDLFSKHRLGADVIEKLIGRKHGAIDG